MKKIKKLTQKQKDAMPGYRDMWIAHGLRCGETDWETAEHAVREMYELSGRKPVPITRVASPSTGAFAASYSNNAIAAIREKSSSKKYGPAPGLDGTVCNTVEEAVNAVVEVDAHGLSPRHGKAEWHDWYGGQLWAGWAAWSGFYVEVCNWTPEKKIQRAEKAYRDLALSACYMWPNEDFAMICARPSHIHMDDQGRLHSDSEKAIQWSNGWGVYSLYGVRITNEAYITTPAEQMDPLVVLKEKNAEVRAALIRRVGIERIIAHLPHKALDTTDDYTLLSVQLSGSIRDARYLKMRNPSVGIWHMEGVGEECGTVQEALNWRTYGDKTREWKPSVLT